MEAVVDNVRWQVGMPFVPAGVAIGVKGTPRFHWRYLVLPEVNKHRELFVKNLLDFSRQVPHAREWDGYEGVWWKWARQGANGYLHYLAIHEVPDDATIDELFEHFVTRGLAEPFERSQ